MFSQASSFTIEGLPTFNAASAMYITYNHLPCKPRQESNTITRLLLALRFWKRREHEADVKECAETLNKGCTSTEEHTATTTSQTLPTCIPGAEDHTDDLINNAEEVDLYIENEAELEAGSGGDVESDGIGGSGGGIAAYNSRSNLAFNCNAHVSAGDGGKGSNGGKGGHGGAVGSHNTDSTQHYRSSLSAGRGGLGDIGCGGLGGSIGTGNWHTVQDFVGHIKAGSGGDSSSGQGGAGGDIGMGNKNTVQIFKGSIKAGNGGTGKFGRGGSGGSIGCGNR